MLTILPLAGGVLGEQADEEVDPAEVAVGQDGQPGPDLRSISTSYKPAMHCVYMHLLL
jgi:hypothetical protein